MFGIWRTLLAIEVVLYHLAGVRIIGQYAVFAFFVLSGFLMTAIMQRSYGYSVGGFTRYLQNRALRLYPNYWFALTVSVLLIVAFGAARMQAYNIHLVLPDSAVDGVKNATMLFGTAPFDQISRLVPPSWALTVEIIFYILIGLGLSRTRVTTAIWIVLSLLYIVIADMTAGGGPTLYSAIPAGSLPFSMGAMTWHFRDEIHQRLQRLKLDRPVGLIVVRWLSWAAFLGANQMTGRGWLIPLGNYVNIILAMMIVCVLFHQRPGERLRRIDKAVGDYSYPIYLLHWQGAAIASMLLFGVLTRGPTPTGLAAAALGLVITVLLGWICVRLIDPAVERRRTKIRNATA